MITTAAVPIRRSFFEVFWYSHQIFIFIYPVLHFHGSGHVIKEQINLDEHNPEWCSQPQNLEIWGDSGNLCPVPEYTGENLNLNIARKKFIYLKNCKSAYCQKCRPRRTLVLVNFGLLCLIVVNHFSQYVIKSDDVI